MSARRAEAAGATLIAALGGILVTLAAVAGPGRILPDSRQDEPPRPDPRSGTRPPVRGLNQHLVHTQGQATSQPTHDPTALYWLLVALLLAVLVLAGILLLRTWRRRGGAGMTTELEAERLPDGVQEGDDADDVGSTARRGLARTVAEQREALAVGDPRNAIVACWLAFEEYADGAGVARAPWETSSEFVVRFLRLVDADSEAVARLSALFHEARFSSHPLGETERTEALAALDAIRAALRTGREAVR